MKRIYHFVLVSTLLLYVSFSSAQVAINTDGSLPDESAILDVESTSKGVLFPRLTTAERDAINSPAAGLIFFNTDLNILQICTGYSWETISESNCREPVYDAINNEYYQTIRLGTQCWMTENLRSIFYNDGTSIPLVGDPNTWSSITTPARCWYNNDASNAQLYGALYNWYSINTGKLCPTGWHVPSNDEWTVLENYLIANGFNYDGSTSGNKVAKSMASTSNWYQSNSGGTPGNTSYPSYRNKSGFNAMPGGFRNFFGDFQYLTNYGCWWSSSWDSSQSAWYNRLASFEEDLIHLKSNKRLGYSVRCIRD